MTQDVEFILETVLIVLHSTRNPLHDLDGDLSGALLQVVGEEDCAGRASSEDTLDAVLGDTSTNPLKSRNDELEDRTSIDDGSRADLCAELLRKSRSYTLVTMAHFGLGGGTLARGCLLRARRSCVPQLHHLELCICQDLDYHMERGEIRTESRTRDAQFVVAMIIDDIVDS